MNPKHVYFKFYFNTMDYFKRFKQNKRAAWWKDLIVR